MSDKEQAPLWPLADKGCTLENVKFFRGSRDMITVEEFQKEFHSALLQKKLKKASVSKDAPKSKVPEIDLKEFVATL
jgi:hypothetical protein